MSGTENWNQTKVAMKQKTKAKICGITASHRVSRGKGERERKRAHGASERASEREQGQNVLNHSQQ